MKEYKYSLRKGSRKDICPACNHRTFTPYVDAAGMEVGPGVGRCDRENSCRYHLTPSQWRDYHRPLTPSDAPRGGLPTKMVAAPAPPAPSSVANLSLISSADMCASMTGYSRNSLARFLSEAFAELLPKEKLEGVLVKMGVGTSAKWGGSPVFWLVDESGRVRDGKVMGYNPQDGHRVKKPFPQFTTVRSLLRDRYQGTSRPCMFGAHLLKSFPDNTPLWIFESEKAAVIAALAMEWGGCWLGIPMAAGGCSGFNPTPENMADPLSRVAALSGRRVVLFPDEGKFDEWSEKGARLRGFSEEVYISTAMERNKHATEIECDIEPGDGFDDLILRYIAAGKDLATLLLTSYGYHGTCRLDTTWK